MAFLAPISTIPAPSGALRATARIVRAPVCADLLAALGAHYARLDDGARRLRFHAAVSSSAAQRWALRENPDAVVGLRDAAGVLRGAATLYIDPAPGGAGPAAGEIALSVEAPWRGTGHGLALACAIRDDARMRGVACLRAATEDENCAMLALVRRLGGLVPGGPGPDRTCRIGMSAPAA